MHDAAKIVGGLVLFVAVMTSPFWYNALTAAPAAVPALDAPPNGSKECVEPRAYMRANHMDLLNEWRDLVVRAGERSYVSTANGRAFDMSLSRTCLDCHSNKADFCDRCHTFMAVDPPCWDCHVEPKEAP